MSKLITDYTGRLVDLDLFGANDDPALHEGLMSFSPGSMVGGKFKEAQKFLRILFSNPNLITYKKYGADLMTILNHGTIVNDTQFHIYFASSKADVINFLKAAKKSSGIFDDRFRVDEYIVDVSIQALDVDAGSIKLSLNFTYADDDADILIPVRIPVG